MRRLVGGFEERTFYDIVVYNTPTKPFALHDIITETEKSKMLNFTLSVE